MLPFKENIAHIADFFKDAQGKINIVFKNLDLLKGVGAQKPPTVYRALD